jgi:hypothetical protein
VWGKAHDTPVERKDVVATATAFTALSIRDALRLYVVKKGKFSELIVSGGGTKNPTLMRALSSGVEDLWDPFWCEGGSCLCGASVRNLEPQALECPVGDWGQEAGGAGEDFVTVKKADRESCLIEN